MNGKKHWYTSFVLEHMGSWNEEAGDRELARRYYKKALSIRKRVWGDDNPNTVECYYAIGRVLERMGKYWRAKPYLEHALKFNRKILGEEHPTTAQSYGMMGKLYISQKKYEKAVECYRHAYEIFEHTLGPDDQLTGMAKETLENAEKEIR